MQNEGQTMDMTGLKRKDSRAWETRNGSHSVRLAQFAGGAYLAAGTLCLIAGRLCEDSHKRLVNRPSQLVESLELGYSTHHESIGLSGNSCDLDMRSSQADWA